MREFLAILGSFIAAYFVVCTCTYGCQSLFIPEFTTKSCGEQTFVIEELLADARNTFLEFELDENGQCQIDFLNVDEDVLQIEIDALPKIELNQIVLSDPETITSNLRPAMSFPRPFSTVFSSKERLATFSLSNQDKPFSKVRLSISKTPE